MYFERALSFRHASRPYRDDQKLRAFCEKWGIAELADFGSVLREDFRPDSDIDFLVTWKFESPRPFDFFALKEEMWELLGRDVDVIQRHVLEQDYNEFRREGILGSARTVYAVA